MKSLSEEFGLNLKGVCQNINELDGGVQEDPDHDVYSVKRDNGTYGIFMYHKTINKFVDINDMTYMFVGMDPSHITKEDIEKLRIPKDIIVTNREEFIKETNKNKITKEFLNKCKEVLKIFK